MRILNHTLTFNEATRRDWEAMKAITREFFAQFSNPVDLLIYVVASFILAAIIVAPWLSDNSEWAWK